MTLNKFSVVLWQSSSFSQITQTKRKKTKKSHIVCNVLEGNLVYIHVFLCFPARLSRCLHNCLPAAVSSKNNRLSSVVCRKPGLLWVTIFQEHECVKTLKHAQISCAHPVTGRNNYEKNKNSVSMKQCQTKRAIHCIPLGTVELASQNTKRHFFRCRLNASLCHLSPKKTWAPSPTTSRPLHNKMEVPHFSSSLFYIGCSLCKDKTVWLT